MNESKKILKQLERIKIEDYIWIGYFFIIIFALVSNHFERRYILTKDKTSYINFHNINTTILIVAFSIYLYYFILSYDNVKESDPKNFYANFWNEVASLMVLIAGAIFIYTDFKNTNQEVEVEIT